MEKHFYNWTTVLVFLLQLSKATQSKNLRQPDGHPTCCITRATYMQQERKKAAPKGG